MENKHVWGVLTTLADSEYRYFQFWFQEVTFHRPETRHDSPVDPPNEDQVMKTGQLDSSSSLSSSLNTNIQSEPVSEEQTSDRPSPEGPRYQQNPDWFLSWFHQFPSDTRTAETLHLLRLSSPVQTELTCSDWAHLFRLGSPVQTGVTCSDWAHVVWSSWLNALILRHSG